jgi:hypothetical protein
MQGWFGRLGAACAATVAIVVFLSSTHAHAGRTRTYAIVIAQNRSLDPGVRPLRYADDDGVKNWELLSLYADRSALFVVLDEETARLHPDAARVAEVPEKAAILQRLAAFNDQMAADLACGDDPELFFVYAGHGDVDAAGQGYVNLHDAKLTRSDLFREVVGPSKARFVHVIIDACKSYFMVNARGSKRWVDDSVDPKSDRGDAAVRAFLAEEQLERYPRAGVIVATSGDQETHEWSRYQAGILSHELRSGLTGAADVNGDGRVEYSELRAFLAAANARVRNPEARLEVFSRPPALDRHRPLVDLRRAQANAVARFLHFSPEVAGRYHIEDERGVRWADLHKQSGHGFDVVLASRRNYYVRRDETEEAPLRTPGAARVELTSLTWKPCAIAARGALDDTFRQDLYKVPFGRGFYDGYVATSGDVPVEGGEAFVVREATRIPTHRLSAGYLFSSSPAGGVGLAHGADLRYGARIFRFLEAGLSAQFAYGTGGTSPADEQHVLRVALLGTLAGEYLPRDWVALRAELGLGWQLLSGVLELGGVRVDGAEGRGLRLELTGAVGFRVASPLWLFARGGLAVDGVYPASAASSTRPNGLFSFGAQLRL